MWGMAKCSPSAQDRVLAGPDGPIATHWLWAGSWPACPPGRAQAGRPTCYFEARGEVLKRSVSPGAGRGEEGRTFRANVNFLHQIF